MLLEKVKDNQKDIEVALKDLHYEDVAVFKSGNDTVIVSFVKCTDPRSFWPKQFIVFTNIFADVFSFGEMSEFLKSGEFGFAYYKPYQDLDIYY